MFKTFVQILCNIFSITKIGHEVVMGNSEVFAQLFYTLPRPYTQ